MALSIDLNSPDFQHGRDAAIEALRAQGDWARTADGAVVFFNQEDAIEVLRCENFQFAFTKIDQERSPYLAKAIEHELLNMHGDAHERLAQLLKRALRDRVFEDMRSKIERIVDRLVEGLPNEGEIDFCSQFADPLPAQVLGPMFGIPYDRVDGLNEWIKIGGRKTDALQSGVDIELVEDANRNLHTYLRGLLRERQKDLGEDLLSELINAEIDGDRMSEDELVYLCSELAAAGVDTTRVQLPLVLNALMDHPTEMAKLRDDPKLALRTVDEGMRFAPLPWVLPHRATGDFPYKDIAFSAGDIAFVMVPAANRDPSVVADPHTFNITRDRVRHFAFGAGMHGCPGAQLARMEMSIALEAFATRFQELRRVTEPVWEDGHVGRTLKELRLYVRKHG
ncbi:MAG: cytochrome P450 [Rhizobiaceae bacterium]|nr:cytochrome P450 [Hyphomicrobiales bacterium]NRB29963.1 cytochrome P450 [Rhizobiaceae bacterium]